MKPLSADTPLDVEQRWIAGIRERGPVWRLQRTASLTSLCWRAAQEAFRRARPEATPLERDRWLLAERYGDEAAREVVRRRVEKGFYERAT